MVHFKVTSFCLQSLAKFFKDNFASCFLAFFIIHGIELKNSQIEDPDSQVFDQYLAWATAYALPLITATFIQNTHIFAGLNETLQADDGSNSTPNQVIVNASCALSAIGRGICYTSFSQEFFEAIGLPKATALGLAIATSGIIINGAATLVVRKELMTILPRILKSEDTSCKDITKAMFVALEGIVLSSPFTIELLSALIKQDAIDPSIIAPIITTLFAGVEATYTASILHKAFFGYETMAEAHQTEMADALLGDGGMVNYGGAGHDEL